MSPGIKFFFARIFPLFFLVAGASIAFFGICGLIMARASAGWPTSPGQIVSSSVERHDKRGSSGSRTTYHGEIGYEFSVERLTVGRESQPINQP